MRQKRSRAGLTGWCISDCFGLALAPCFKPVRERIVWAEIDREARKGKPMPSDHAPVVIDLDEPGSPFDPGWAPARDRGPRREAR